MNDYTRKLFDKAMDTIEGAELLLEHGKIDVAAGQRIMLCSTLPRPCLMKKGCSSVHTVMSLVLTEKSFPKRSCLTRNSIAG